ncbi:antibiotic biosynthesis monooxygenase family protein [Nocardia acidivorans]|uniref:antibiotic biosynthesis monooxygenase family protein n=1 Tax=Nocardia acidivorans TaxID=404580 RepID=UPI00082D27DB|nr:antibiotic biosynthesis monooxygenase family protein [Nocardia acidivorans]
MRGVFVIVYLRAPRGDRRAVRAAYRRISWVNEAVPGLLRAELLTDEADPDRMALLSEWVDLPAFRAWQSGPDHEGGKKNSALRDYQDRSHGPHYVVYRQDGVDDADRPA